MKPIVPSGYAIDPKALENAKDELRKERAAELANASDADRARIEKEIHEQALKKLRQRRSFWHLIH